MQVIENWANIRGCVSSIEQHPTVDGQMLAEVALEQVTPEGNFPNLVGADCGRQIALMLPAETAEALGLKKGSEITARIQKTGPNAHVAARDHLSLAG